MQDNFITYINRLIEHNENSEVPIYRPSLLESPEEKHEYIEILYLETKIQRHNDPRYWVKQYILQIKYFQYKLFQNNIINEDTIPQINFLHFVSNFSRFNYQLKW